MALEESPCAAVMAIVYINEDCPGCGTKAVNTRTDVNVDCGGDHRGMTRHSINSRIELRLVQVYVRGLAGFGLTFRGLWGSKKRFSEVRVLQV